MNSNLTRQLRFISKGAAHLLVVSGCFSGIVLAGDVNANNKEVDDAFLLTIIEDVSISGKITDENGEGLPGVSILERGTTNGTITDGSGNYNLTVSDDAILEVSYIGYVPVSVELNGRTVIDLQLEVDATQLEEVVVTTLGFKKERRSLGYSLTEVGGEELTRVKLPNAINALQGKIAGVNITQNSTGAAGSSRVVIRGASSLSGNNQPLYIVDGIPIGNSNNGSAGLWGGSDGGDGISSINPDDIESVSVLKGGAASALYGSRASGGVIIVTTKSGRGSGRGQQGFGVELSSSITFDKVDASLQDLQTEYGQGERGEKPVNEAEAFDLGLSSWGARLDNSSVVQWDGVERPYSYVGSNLDHFYRTGTTFINTVALNSSSENISYRFSASNLDNEDVIPNADLNRKTFSLNTDAVLAKKVTVSVNAKYIIENVNNRPRLSDAPGNGNFTVANLSPNVDVRFMDPGTKEDGTERGYSNNTFSQNPYFAAYNFRNEDTKSRVISSGLIRYDILDWLYLSGRAGVDHFTIRRTAVEPFGTAYKLLGSIEESEIRYTQVDADLILGAKKDITNKISAAVFVGVNSNTIDHEILIQKGDQFIVPGLEDVGNTSNQSRDRNPDQQIHGYGERKIGSLYESVELSYDGLAYITFTGRTDWLSTLSFPGKTSPNSDFYPSISASLLLSEIFNTPDYIDLLKIRGGYSQVAGGARQPYQLAFLYEIFDQGHQGQPLGRVSGNNVPNPDLIPFNKDEVEIGLDAVFFNNRLSLDFAYYENKTTNDIVDVSVSEYSGFDAAKANIGEIENKGVEILLNVMPVKTRNFSWSAGINATVNRGKILATNDTGADINLDEPRSRNVRITHVVGETYGTIFGVSYDRDDNGNIRYEIDGDGVPLAVPGERKILGEGVPPIIAGFSNTLTYKNLSLNFLIDGKFGGQVFSGTNTVLYGNGLHKSTLKGREKGLDVSGVKGEDDTPFTATVAPADLETYYGRINDIAEQFVQDSDYIKFRQLSLGYRFPRSLLDKTFLTGVTISAIGSNLFYLMRSVDNIDPESAYSVGNSQGLEYFGVPSSRSYGFNLNVQF